MRTAIGIVCDGDLLRRVARRRGGELDLDGAGATACGNHSATVVGLGEIAARHNAGDVQGRAAGVGECDRVWIARATEGLVPEVHFLRRQSHTGRIKAVDLRHKGITA